MNEEKTAGARKRPAQQLSVEQVSERIRAAILRGELKPGAKLTEQDLAEELQVSRTPVREAIRQLEVERLVTRVPFVGVTVSQPTPDEVLELLEIREVLEGLVARLATRHMDDAHLKRLRASQAKLAECARRADVAGYLDHALAFRRALVECCRSDSLAQYVLVIENRLRLVGNRTALLPGRMEASIGEHEKLLTAITEGDAAQAEQLNRERIQHIRDAFARSMAFSLL